MHIRAQAIFGGIGDGNQHNLYKLQIVFFATFIASNLCSFDETIQAYINCGFAFLIAKCSKLVLVTTTGLELGFQSCIFCSLSRFYYLCVTLFAFYFSDSSCLPSRISFI